jgi:putative membrane protein
LFHQVLVTLFHLWTTSMMKLLLAASASACLLAGAAAAQDYQYNWTPAGTLAPTPAAPAFLMFASAGDLYEIQSSQLVLETTQNPDIRRFAQMMVEHHTKTTQDAAAAAVRAGLTPPTPMLDAPKTAMLASLRAYTGVERDRLYITQQMMAHKEALGLMKTYAETGDTPELRTAAQATVGIVQSHLAMVERLAR